MVTPANIAILVDGLRKSYGDVLALDNLNLVVPAGQCFGLLGPNGAGKTTAMNIISTYLKPDSGDVRVKGLKTSEKPSQVRSILGVDPGNQSL